MIISQKFYDHKRLLYYIYDADKKNTIFVCLLVGWVFSGPLPSSSGLMSTYFKCNAEDVKLVSQVKAWYELESQGSYKQADAANQQAHNHLESTTYHDGERY